MKTKLLLILSFIITNCYSSEETNETKSEAYIESGLYNIIYNVIIQNKIYGNSDFNNFINQQKIYYIRINGITHCSIENKKINSLIKWLITSINFQQSTRYRPNYLFLSLYKAIQESKNEAFSFAKLITCENDLETVFRLMLIKLNKLADATDEERQQALKKDPDNTDPAYQDNLIQACIARCKNHKSPGKYFFDCMLDAILTADYEWQN